MKHAVGQPSVPFVRLSLIRKNTWLRSNDRRGSRSRPTTTTRRRSVDVPARAVRQLYAQMFSVGRFAESFVPPRVPHRARRRFFHRHFLAGIGSTIDLMLENLPRIVRRKHVATRALRWPTWIIMRWREIVESGEEPVPVQILCRETGWLLAEWRHFVVIAVRTRTRGTVAAAVVPTKPKATATRRFDPIATNVQLQLASASRTAKTVAT